MHRKIGVIDTGIGGLSVMNGLQKLLPNEDIIYFGDSKNCPYGNRSEKDILDLTLELLYFMKEKNVKLVAIACNTISTIINLYDYKFDFPIIDIISPTVEHIFRMDTRHIAILGTEFTIKSKTYEKLLIEKDANLKIISESSKDLAQLIDSGDFHSQILKDIIKTHTDNISKSGSVYNLVLACTHYPIVEDQFFDLAPKFNYINPGFQQSRAIREYLYNNNLLNNKLRGSLQIYTSGERQIYEKVVKRLDIKNVEGIYKT